MHYLFVFNDGFPTWTGSTHCLFVFNDGFPTWTGRQPGYSYFTRVSKLGKVIALLSDRRDLNDF